MLSSGQVIFLESRDLNQHLGIGWCLLRALDLLMDLIIYTLIQK